VVVGVALARQAPALDGVGEQHGRPVRVNGTESVDEQAEVVPAQVAHRGGELGGGNAGEQGAQLVPGLLGEDAVGDLRGLDPQHPLVLLVGHCLEAFSQLGAAAVGEDFADRPAPLQGSHLPPGRGEHGLQPFNLDVGYDTVQRLAVEVDHPQQLPKLGHGWVGHRLPDRTLVELGVTEQADEPTGGWRVGEVGGDVAVRHRRPQGRGGADPDRAGGEVDGVGVLES